MRFFMDGPCGDLCYLNTRDHPRGAEHKRFVEELYGRFHQLADRHFREDARSHFLQRFWEMYLAVALLERGFDLKHPSDEGPDFLADIGTIRVWFEAIAPEPGDGRDQVPQLVHGKLAERPDERILLRLTAALVDKRKQYDRALAKGIISRQDRYVLAINSRGIQKASYGSTMPLFVQAFLAIGPLQVVFDSKTEITDSFYKYRPAIQKLSGCSVSTRAFLDNAASFCSAVLHSSVDCANYPKQLGGDFCVLHNPNAQRPLDEAVFQWCEQFTLRGNQMHRSKPNLTVTPVTS